MDDETPPTSDGIYTECATCGVLVANQTTHQAWHDSREGS